VTRRFLILLLLSALVVACGSRRHRVTIRMIDGKPQETRFISPAAYGHYLQAQIALNRGELETALEELQGALIHDPKSPHLNTTLAGVLIQLGRNKQAHVVLELVLKKLEPGHPDALVLEGQLHRRENNRSRAEKAFRRDIELNPDHGPAYLHLAAMLEESGKPDAAASVLRSMLKRVEGQPRVQAHRRLATLCLRQVDYGCASRQFQLVLRHSTDLRTLLKLAHVHRALGETKAAVALLREAFDRSGGAHQVAALLLELLHHEKRKQEVDDLLGILETAAEEQTRKVRGVAELGLQVDRPRRALKLVDEQIQRLKRDRKPATPELSLTRGTALFKLGRAAEGKPELTALLDGPAGPHAALRLADGLERLGRRREACAVLRKVLKRHGDSAGLVLALSRLLHQLGEKDASIQVVRRALDRRPDDRGLRFGLAAALERTGSWREALTHVRRILKRRPKDAPALNFLGYTLADRGERLEEARRRIRKALYLQPGEGYIIDSLGWLYYRNGERSKAFKLLQMAARLSPQEPEILAHLAEVHVSLKRFNRAVLLYRRAIKVSEDVHLTAKLKKRLHQLERERVGTR
jgi:Flp pilus assembly protein TadD